LFESEETSSSALHWAAITMTAAILAEVG